jgi:Co/Zn/Cd efflux system component
MDAIAMVRLAMSVITDRLITILVMAMAFALACWTMYAPDFMRVAVLGIFVLFSYLVLHKEQSRASKSTET